MPDRDLPEHLKDRLSAALNTGAPLKAPLPTQARYAQAVARASKTRLPNRLVMLAGAAAFALVLLGLVGPAQPREWIVQSVGSLAKNAGAPVGPASSSPSPGDHGRRETSPTPVTRTNDASPSPEAKESPEPAASPEPAESPEPSQSPDGGQTHASPSPEPSDGGGVTYSSPSPSPSPSPGAPGSGDGGG